MPDYDPQNTCDPSLIEMSKLKNNQEYHLFQKSLMIKAYGKKCWVCNQSSGRLDKHEFLPRSIVTDDYKRSALSMYVSVLLCERHHTAKYHSKFFSQMFVKIAIGKYGKDKVMNHLSYLPKRYSEYLGV